jgi:hypothetical protein
VGRSNIVAKLLALILMQKGIDATVTVRHSRSKDLAALTRSADIVVVAIGKAHFLRADMVRPGAVVIDVGMNATADSRPPGRLASHRPPRRPRRPGLGRGRVNRELYGHTSHDPAPDSRRPLPTPRRGYA